MYVTDLVLLIKQFQSLVP